MITVFKILIFLLSLTGVFYFAHEIDKLKPSPILAANIFAMSVCSLLCGLFFSFALLAQ